MASRRAAGARRALAAAASAAAQPNAAVAAADEAASAHGGPVAAVVASMRRRLAQRGETGKLRRLPEPAVVGSADFTSNDYLGLARCPELARRVQAEADRVAALSQARGGPIVGATGSRLLSGTTWYHEEMEEWMAGFFRRESALVFNSGYDLNLGLLAALARPGDAVVFDEYVHNSSVMGLRLGGWHHFAASAGSGAGGACASNGARRPQQQQQPRPLHAPQPTYRFRHNDLGHLRDRLSEARAAGGPDALLYVAVESVYSMDGDVAPLAAICDAAAEFGAAVIVDEAHSTGVLGPGGRGLVAQEALEDHPALLCSIHTFGKALGCHGAVLCGPAVLKEYCANYCAPFIYSTAASFHSLAAMRVACEFQAQQGEARRQHLHALVRRFRSHLGQGDAALQRALLPSPTPIQAVLVPGNARCSRVAAALQAQGMDVRPLRPPTVPAGKERLRVVLHAHNTAEEVAALARELRAALALHAVEKDDHQDDGDGVREPAAWIAPPRRAGQPPQQPVAAAPATAAAAAAAGGGAGGMSRL